MATRRPLTQEDVRRFIKQLHDLSTIPALLGKIFDLTADEERSTDELVELISYDPAMAQRVLKTANSVFFAHAGQIMDIQQAVMFLGLDRIKHIAAGMTIMNVFPSSGSFHVENLWLHSCEVAYLSAELSDRISVTQPQECFLAGLLHDIGRIIFYNMDHDRFLRIETTDTMLGQETEQFGCTHSQAGAWFAEDIGLPGSIVTTIRHHHQPSEAPEEMNLVSLVSLSEALTRMFSPRIEDDGIWTPEHDAILLEFSLEQNDIKGLEKKFNDARNGIERFFST